MIYYQNDLVTLHLGDCRTILPTLGAVDHVITDPPYSDHVHDKSRAGSRLLEGAGFIADYSRAVDFGFESLGHEVRIDVSHSLAKLVQRWVLVFSDVESSHLWREAFRFGSTGCMDYVRTGAWHKLNGAPQFTGDRPGVGFEAITICHPKGRKRWNGGGRPAIWTHAVVNNRGGNDPRLHPTQKPLPLMADLVIDFTDPGDTILDCFAGSGTTLVAAQNLGRRAIGIERSEEFCEVAAKRLSLGPLFEPEPARQMEIQGWADNGWMVKGGYVEEPA